MDANLTYMHIAQQCQRQHLSNAHSTRSNLTIADMREALTVCEANLNILILSLD